MVAGTGGVSMTTLILAKAAGLTVIVTSSSDDKLKVAREKYGADHTINYKKTPSWGAEAIKLNNGQGVDMVIENGGSGTIKESLEAIKMGGKIAVIGFLSTADQKDMPDVAALALSKGAIVRGITVGSKALLEELVQFVASRKLAPPIDKVFKFDQAIDAYHYLSKGGHIGKVCIEM
jgi:NADPH:quinone reductase-like Zn-dependent oxidoreductase